MSSQHDEPIKAIEGRARTVRELLDTAKYAIDSFQREYALLAPTLESASKC
jgi:hypothetical protein